MNRQPRTSGRRLVVALERAGFRVSHVRGSHYYLRAPNSARLVVVPVHGNHDLPAGTLRSIMRQAQLSSEQLTDLLNR